MAPEIGEKDIAVGVSESSETSKIVEHIVKKGEHLTGIAKEYKTDIETIKKDNGIKNVDYILPGQVLKIRTNYDPVLEAKKEEMRKKAEAERQAKVKEGSRMVRELGFDIIKGIKIPEYTKRPEWKDYTTYAIKKGDTLGAIAKKHGVSVDDIYHKNEKLPSANRIPIGLEIKIPLPLQDKLDYAKESIPQAKEKMIEAQGNLEMAEANIENIIRQLNGTLVELGNLGEKFKSDSKKLVEINADTIKTQKTIKKLKDELAVIRTRQVQLTNSIGMSDEYTNTLSQNIIDKYGIQRSYFEKMGINYSISGEGGSATKVFDGGNAQISGSAGIIDGDRYRLEVGLKMLIDENKVLVIDAKYASDDFLLFLVSNNIYIPSADGKGESKIILTTGMLRKIYERYSQNKTMTEYRLGAEYSYTDFDPKAIIAGFKLGAVATMGNDIEFSPIVTEERYRTATQEIKRKTIKETALVSGTMLGAYGEISGFAFDDFIKYSLGAEAQIHNLRGKYDLKADRVIAYGANGELVVNAQGNLQLILNGDVKRDTEGDTDYAYGGEVSYTEGDTKVLAGVRNYSNGIGVVAKHDSEEGMLYYSEVQYKINPNGYVSLGVEYDDKRKGKAETSIVAGVNIPLGQAGRDIPTGFYKSTEALANFEGLQGKVSPENNKNLILLYNEIIAKRNDPKWTHALQNALVELAPKYKITITKKMKRGEYDNATRSLHNQLGKLIINEGFIATISMDSRGKFTYLGNTQTQSGFDNPNIRQTAPSTPNEKLARSGHVRHLDNTSFLVKVREATRTRVEEEKTDLQAVIAREPIIKQQVNENTDRLTYDISDLFETFGIRPEDLILDINYDNANFRFERNGNILTFWPLHDMTDIKDKIKIKARTPNKEMSQNGRHQAEVTININEKIVPPEIAEYNADFVGEKQVIAGARKWLTIGLDNGGMFNKDYMGTIVIDDRYARLVGGPIIFNSDGTISFEVEGIAPGWPTVELIGFKDDKGRPIEVKNDLGFQVIPETIDTNKRYNGSLSGDLEIERGDGNSGKVKIKLDQGGKFDKNNLGNITLVPGNGKILSVSVDETTGELVVEIEGITNGEVYIVLDSNFKDTDGKTIIIDNPEDLKVTIKDPEVITDITGELEFVAGSLQKVTQKGTAMMTIKVIDENTGNPVILDPNTLGNISFSPIGGGAGACRVATDSNNKPLMGVDANGNLYFEVYGEEVGYVNANISGFKSIDGKDINISKTNVRIQVAPELVQSEEKEYSPSFLSTQQVFTGAKQVMEIALDEYDVFTKSGDIVLTPLNPPYNAEAKITSINFVPGSRVLQFEVEGGNVSGRMKIDLVGFESTTPTGEVKKVKIKKIPNINVIKAPELDQNNTISFDSNSKQEVAAGGTANIILDISGEEITELGDISFEPSIVEIVGNPIYSGGKLYLSIKGKDFVPGFTQARLVLGDNFKGVGGKKVIFDNNSSLNIALTLPETTKNVNASFIDSQKRSIELGASEPLTVTIDLGDEKFNPDFMGDITLRPTGMNATIGNIIPGSPTVNSEGQLVFQMTATGFPGRLSIGFEGTWRNENYEILNVSLPNSYNISVTPAS